jgi:hypothetical protein
MKKIKFSVVAAIALYVMMVVGVSSCRETGGETKNKNEEGLKEGYFEYSEGMWSSMQYRIEEKTIDSCQYIIIFGSDGRNIIHKGNCRNVVHTSQ